MTEEYTTATTQDAALETLTGLHAYTAAMHGQQAEIVNELRTQNAMLTKLLAEQQECNKISAIHAAEATRCAHIISVCLFVSLLGYLAVSGLAFYALPGVATAIPLAVCAVVFVAAFLCGPAHLSAVKAAVGMYTTGRSTAVRPSTPGGSPLKNMMPGKRR